MLQHVLKNNSKNGRVGTSPHSICYKPLTFSAFSQLLIHQLVKSFPRFGSKSHQRGTSRHNQSMHCHLPRKTRYTSVFSSQVVGSKSSGPTWNHPPEIFFMTHCDSNNLEHFFWEMQIWSCGGWHSKHPFWGESFWVLHESSSHRNGWLQPPQQWRKHIFRVNDKNKDPLDQWRAVKSEQPPSTKYDKSNETFATPRLFRDHPHPVEANIKHKINS